MEIPVQLSVGDTVQWIVCRTVDNLGNEISVDTGFSLSYFLRKSDAADDDVIEIAGVARDDGGWDFVIPHSQFAAGDEGTYYWSAKASKAAGGTTVFTIAKGQTTVLPDISSATTFDGRSQAKKDLEAVNAAIRALSSGGVKSYMIGTRTVTKMDIADLLKWRSQLKSDVAREEKADKIAQGLGDPKNLYVRFK